MAHKGETNREWSESVRLDARRPRWREPTDEYGQGTVKPVGPYKVWLDAIAEQGELVLAPCAGSGPALIAAEALWGEDARAVGIDTQPDARSAWEQRRTHLLGDCARDQQYLGTFAEDAP
jgi:DNA modification methylase